MNSLYGKLYENKERRCTAQVRTDPWNFYRRVAKKDCQKWDVLDHDEFLGLLTLPKGEVVFDTPRAAAWAILDLAKVYLYRFWYDCLCQSWPGCKLLYTDTDSCIVLLRSANWAQEAQAWNASAQAGEVGPSAP